MSNEYPKKSSMSSKVEIRQSPIQGKGMFAKKFIKAGETVIIWGGNYVSKEEAIKIKNQGKKLVTQLGKNLYTVEERGDDPTYFINHSCDPNTWMKDSFTFIARRAIQSGEELTADYILWGADEDYIAKWNCNCQSPLCRKKITGRDLYLSELQKCYKDHFTPLLNKRIKKFLR